MPSRSLPVGLVIVLGILGATRSAFAQVEFRCPPGWGRADNAGSVRVTPHPHARDAIALCSGGTQSSIAIAVDQLDAPPTSESGWLHQRLPDIASPAAFRDAQVPGVPGTIRLLEWQRIIPAQGHHAQTVDYGRAALLRVGSGLVTVVSSDVASPDFSWTSPTHATIAAAHRATFDAFLRSMIGLDASTAAWHATASCPSGTAPVSDGLQLVRGWQQIVRCRSADRTIDVEVRESRIPIADLAAARREADLASQIQPWASAEPEGGLSRSMRAVSIGGRTFYIGTLAWPVLRDMGRDNRPQRARFAQAVIPTATGNIQVGWLAREGQSARAEQALRAYVTSGVVP